MLTCIETKLQIKLFFNQKFIPSRPTKCNNAVNVINTCPTYIFNNLWIRFQSINVSSLFPKRSKAFSNTLNFGGSSIKNVEYWSAYIMIPHTPKSTFNPCNSVVKELRVVSCCKNQHRGPNNEALYNV